MINKIITCTALAIACYGCGHHDKKSGETGMQKDTLLTNDTVLPDSTEKIPLVVATPDEVAINQLLSEKTGGAFVVVNDTIAKWLKEDFDYFIVPKRKENHDYPYIAKGDFNGDGRQDAAALVKEKDKPGYQLAVIFGYPTDTKEDIRFWKEDIDVCAVSTYPKGELIGMDTGKVKMKGDGINIEYYEKAAFVIYWDGKALKRVYTAD